MERSVGFNKIGKYDKGFFYLDNAVKLDSSTYLGYRGWLKYEYLRDYDGAIKDFIKLDILTPNFVDYPWGVNIHQLLGNCYAAKKEHEKALIEYSKYLELTEEKEYTGEFFMFYGKALENSNRFKDALDSYSKSIKLDSLRADHHFYKGVLLFKLKRYSEAKTFIDYSLDLYNKKYYYADKYNELYMQINHEDILSYRDSINYIIDVK